MLNNPTVSVIVPVFNGSEHIRTCLEAIFSSTCRDFECIVVDDGSKDDTLLMINRFQVNVLILPKTYGPAYARNRGVEVSKGRILLFIDADVAIRPDTITRVIEDFEKMPAIDALFGSYDDEPGAPNFLSQYKNLFHHYIHQHGKKDASTFWCGCGAIKRDVFIKFGGFNENFRFIEDIELGYRLKAAHPVRNKAISNRMSHSIYLDKSLQVKHLKKYTFLGLLASDIFGRAIPWTMLMLSSGNTVNDLNTKTGNKISLFVAMLLTCSVPFVWTLWGRYSFILLFSVFYLLHKDFYGFFINKRGVFFVLQVIPLHLLYYLYSGFSFVFSSLSYLVKKKKLKKDYEQDSFSKFVFVE